MWLVWWLAALLGTLGVVVGLALILARRNRPTGLTRDESLRRRYVRGDIDFATYDKLRRSRDRDSTSAK